MQYSEGYIKRTSPPSKQKPYVYKPNKVRTPKEKPKKKCFALSYSLSARAQKNFLRATTPK